MGVVLGQNLGQIMSKCCEKSKETGNIIRFSHILLGDYLLKVGWSGEQMSAVIPLKNGEKYIKNIVLVINEEIYFMTWRYVLLY